MSILDEYVFKRQTENLNGWVKDDGFGLEGSRFTLWKNGKIIAAFNNKVSCFPKVTGYILCDKPLF